MAIKWKFQQGEPFQFKEELSNSGSGEAFMLDSEPPVTGGVQAKSHDGIDRIQTSDRGLEVWTLTFPPTNNFWFSPVSLGKALCPQPWNWNLSYTGCGAVRDSSWGLRSWEPGSATY